jgi:hypothetical protein
MAQSNVYSLNVVGYVNVVCSNGFTMVNVPLIPANAQISALLPDDQNGGTVPAGSTVFAYVDGAYIPNINDEFGGGWSNPSQTLTNGQGFFFQNFTPNPTTITFVGEVPQGALNNGLIPGFNMVGSRVPQGGFIADLGLVSPGGDTVYRYKAGAYQTYINDEFGGGWSGSDADFDAVKGPNLKVGEGMFYFRSDLNGAPTWNRNFTVQ